MYVDDVFGKGLVEWVGTVCVLDVLFVLGWEGGCDSYPPLQIMSLDVTSVMGLVG